MRAASCGISTADGRFRKCNIGPQLVKERENHAFRDAAGRALALCQPEAGHNAASRKIRLKAPRTPRIQPGDLKAPFPTLPVPERSKPGRCPCRPDRPCCCRNAGSSQALRGRCPGSAGHGRSPYSVRARPLPLQSGQTGLRWPFQHAPQDILPLPSHLLHSCICPLLKRKMKRG